MGVDQGGSEGIEGTETTPEAPDLGGEGLAEEGEHVESEYSPDYKFKFYGKEAEMDEWARGFIRDKDTEDRFRQLYAKSNGFDVLRERYQARDGEYQGLQSKFQEVEQRANQHQETLEEIRHLRDNDLSGFFEYCGIKPDQLIDFVEQHLEYLKKPESERQVYDKARGDSLRARELERENQRLQAQFESQVQTNHENEFQGYLEHPEVSEFVERYDSLVGKEGAFRQAVIDYGDMMWLRNKQYVQPLDAIRAVYRQYKPFVSGHASAQGGADEDSQETTDHAPRKRPATIPNLGNGSATSPTRKVYSSLDDLKKHVKAMTAED